MVSKSTKTKKAVRSKNADEDSGGDTDEEKERYERAREENAKRGPNLNDVPLILKHDNGDDGKEESRDQDGEKEEDDSSFVPIKR